jgi:hypothetical protein
MTIKQRKFASAVSLVEVIIVTAVFAVVTIGALSYQYHAAKNAQIAHAQITATCTAQLLLEDWKSTGGSQSYDPAKLGMGFSTASVPHPVKAVQLEFFVEDGVGQVRITNDCTVVGYQRNSDSTTYDYEINPGGSEINEFRRYDTYAYHYVPKNAEASGQRITVPIDQTYVTQSFGGVASEPGGQIFVEGNVVIGGDLTVHDGKQVRNSSLRQPCLLIQQGG